MPCLAIDSAWRVTARPWIAPPFGVPRWSIGSSPALAKCASLAAARVTVVKEVTKSRLRISRHSTICTSRCRLSLAMRWNVSWTDCRSPSITWSANGPSRIRKLVMTANSFFF